MSTNDYCITSIWVYIYIYIYIYTRIFGPRFARPQFQQSRYEKLNYLKYVIWKTASICMFQGTLKSLQRPGRTCPVFFCRSRKIKIPIHVFAIASDAKAICRNSSPLPGGLFQLIRVVVQGASVSPFGYSWTYVRISGAFWQLGAPWKTMGAAGWT